MNDIIKSVKSTLEERKTLHINDPAINKYWTKLTEYLSISEQLTIDYFNECDSDDVLLLSEIFEDISLNLKSKKFIRTLKNLQLKFPNIDIASSIDIAEKYSKL